MKIFLIKVSFLLLLFYSLAACKDNNSSTAENPTHQEQIRKIDNDKNSSSFEYPTNQEETKKIDDYKKMMPDKRLLLEKEKQEIDEKISVLAREEANKILKKKSIWAIIDKIDPNMVVELKSLLDAPLTGPGSKTIEELKNGLNFATQVIDLQKIGKGWVPDDLIQMKNDFAKKIAEQEKNDI